MLLLNNVEIKPTIFPDGTQQVWKLPQELLSAGKKVIKWYFENDAELMTLIQLQHLVRAKTLVVPYFPYGRQDKPISNDLCFGMSSLIDVLIGLKFDRIETFDAHGEVGRPFYRSDCDTSVIDKKPAINFLCAGIDYVVYPDRGAEKRYSVARPTITFDKVRDQATGKITSYMPYSTTESHINEITVDKCTCLVVDDICDGGATFLLLGQALKQYGLRPSLYVSHGVFSRGQEGVNELKKFYNRIITTDSRLNVRSLTGIEVLPCGM